MSRSETSTRHDSFQVVEDTRTLQHLTEAWAGLEARHVSPPHQHIWAGAAIETLAPGRAPKVLIVGPQERPAAVAPVVSTRGAPGVMRLVGAELNEPVDVVSAGPDALASLTTAMVKLKAPIFLGKLRAGTPTVAALERAYRGSGVVVSRPAPPVPYIALDSGWAEPEGNLDAGRRSDIRRARRRAEAIGPVGVEIVSPTPAELPPLLEEAYRIEAAGWKGRLGSALAQDDVRGAFYRRYAAAAAARGILRLCFLSIGGRGAAMQMAVECADRFWVLKIGYDETFARCSPGTLLMVASVADAAVKGLASYELGGQVEPWIRVWTEREHRCVTVMASPVGVRSLGAMAAHRMSLVGHRRSGRARGA
jgi:CelD/BcsL family acetyltransferase involved in cellulose biosynthesis